MKKKHQEVCDILIAWLAISFCFAIVLGGYSVLGYVKTKAFNFSWAGFLTNFGLSLIITATSFIFHELAHKHTAIHFGGQGRFVLWPAFLLIGVVFAVLFGFIFIAPGAVYIYGKQYSKKDEGLVSLAGPATNIIMALLFLVAGTLGAPIIVISYGLFINLWIAFFNLIPIGPLDGAKIIRWNALAWVVAIAIPTILMFAFGLF